MSADLLRRAAARLRESRAALPDHQRIEPWSVIGDGEPAVIEAGGMWVVDCGYGAQQTAAHIALAASPDGTDADADLLDEIAEWIDARFAIPSRVIDRAVARAHTIFREDGDRHE